MFLRLVISPSILMRTPTLAGTAQLAFQQAKLAGDNIKAFLEGKELRTKHFEELGEALSLGTERAAVLTGGKAFGGALARQARFALYTSRLPTWHHRLRVGASWFLGGTEPRPLIAPRFGTLIVYKSGHGDGKVKNSSWRSISVHCFAGHSCD